MIIPEYESLPVTTMTMITTLTNKIDKNLAFELLPVRRIEMPDQKKSAKCKLPHAEGMPGTILSNRYKWKVRGIVRSNKKPFKNAVTMDMSISHKNIGLKLSSTSIQICGASRKSDGEEAVSMLVGHLNEIERTLSSFRRDPRLADETIEWIKEHSAGRWTVRDVVEKRKISERTVSVRRKADDREIVRIVGCAPEHLDQRTVDYLVSFGEEFDYHGDFCKKLDFIRSVKSLCLSPGPIGYNEIDQAMLNYNYTLGFQVNRTALNSIIDTIPPFLSRYNNELTNSVTIEVPYEPERQESIKKKKNKVPHHTFLVYRSGAVTQSGPSVEMMREIYYLFMNTISDIQHRISC